MAAAEADLGAGGARRIADLPHHPFRHAIAPEPLHAEVHGVHHQQIVAIQM